MCLSLFRKKSRGSGSFVTADKQFFLLTCCHNFITPPNSPKALQAMPLDELKQEVTTNCQSAKYGVSDMNTFAIKYKRANDVLALDGGRPRIHFDQVGR